MTTSEAKQIEIAKGLIQVEAGERSMRDLAAHVGVGPATVSRMARRPEIREMIEAEQLRLVKTASGPATDYLIKVVTRANEIIASKGYDRITPLKHGNKIEPGCLTEMEAAILKAAPSAIDRITQITGIAPSPTTATMVQTVFQDNRGAQNVVTPDLLDIVGRGLAAIEAEAVTVDVCAENVRDSE